MYFLLLLLLLVLLTLKISTFFSKNIISLISSRTDLTDSSLVGQASTTTNPCTPEINHSYLHWVEIPTM